MSSTPAHSTVEDGGPPAYAARFGLRAEIPASDRRSIPRSSLTVIGRGKARKTNGGQLLASHLPKPVGPAKNARAESARAAGSRLRSLRRASDSCVGGRCSSMARSCTSQVLLTSLYAGIIKVPSTAHQKRAGEKIPPGARPLSGRGAPLPVAGAAVHAHVRHHPRAAVHPRAAMKGQPSDVPIDKGKVIPSAVTGWLVARFPVLRRCLPRATRPWH